MDLIVQPVAFILCFLIAEAFEESPKYKVDNISIQLMKFTGIVWAVAFFLQIFWRFLTFVP